MISIMISTKRDLDTTRSPAVCIYLCPLLYIHVRSNDYYINIVIKLNLIAVRDNIIILKFISSTSQFLFKLCTVSVPLNVNRNDLHKIWK